MYRHAEIIIKEMSGRYFSKGTDIYQEGQIGQLINYIELIKNSKGSSNSLLQIMLEADKALENSNWEIFIEDNEVKYRRR